MASKQIVVVGLPGSGKTTFLAALWHLIFGREVPTALKFDSIARGDFAHLNAIADRWLRAEEQNRTLPADNQVVSLNLLDGIGQPAQITFPDLAGETFSRMWEQRECTPEVGAMLQDGNVLMFVNAVRITYPLSILDVNRQAGGLGGVGEAEQEPVPWSADMAPTQVQLVSLLSLLSEHPLDVGPRKLCVVLSAWDKAKGEGLSPTAFLAAKLPLLRQYLGSNAAAWELRIYGVSAQGGDYDGAGAKRAEAEQLRAMNEPSKRILLVPDALGESHDLTVPLAWLIS